MATMPPSLTSTMTSTSTSLCSGTRLEVTARFVDAAAAMLPAPGAGCPPQAGHVDPEGRRRPRYNRSWSKKLSSPARVSSPSSTPAMIDVRARRVGPGVADSLSRPACTVLIVRSRTISKAASFWSQ